MIHRLVFILLLLLVSVGCTDPCAPGAPPSLWDRAAAALAGAVGNAVNPFSSVPPSASQQCAAPPDTFVAPSLTDRAGSCAVAAGDDACVACLKAACCVEVQACDEACFAAGAGEAGTGEAYRAVV